MQSGHQPIKGGFRMLGVSIELMGAGPREAMGCAVCDATDGLTLMHAELSGSPFAVRLCRAHADRMARKMRELVSAMRAEHANSSPMGSRRLRDGEALADIREWAHAAGYPVSSGGSVSPRVIAAYRQAQGEPKIDADADAVG